MKIIDIKIKKSTILLPNLKEEDITSYKMIYKKKSKEISEKAFEFANENFTQDKILNRVFNVFKNIT